MKLTQKSTSSKIQEQVSEMQVANKIYVMHMTNYFCKSKSVDTIQQMIIVKYIPSNFGAIGLRITQMSTQKETRILCRQFLIFHFSFISFYSPFIKQYQQFLSIHI